RPARAPLREVRGGLPWARRNERQPEARVMPVHDWTRVSAGIFHHFHLEWIGAPRASTRQSGLAGNPLRDLAGGLIHPVNLEDLMYRVTCRGSCFKIGCTTGFAPAMEQRCPVDL